MERAARVEDLFHRALERPASERRAFVQREAGDDTALATEVLTLIAADGDDRSTPEPDLADLAQAVLEPSVAIPDLIGPYRIEGLLGRGGMGVVYLGVRDDVGRRVAIKVLPDATLSPHRAARFRREQRLLAGLEHPAIARLYDADILPDGTPYFAMELVDGLTLTEYCTTYRLGLRDRLALFRQVCEAVREAHRRAIIHRDLKPSNMLVRRDATSGQATVKLLDFGIAKRLDDLADGPALTRFGPGPMTPAYAAPEQHRGEALGLYTDVYALGVVLYELLTESVPYDLSDLTPGQAEARVVTGNPEPPSSRARQAIQQGKLSAPPTRHQWTDLDLICLTAMANEPSARYGSVEALIRDLDHYLADEPLEARPPSLSERLRKLLVRHRAVVLGTAAALLALVAFTVTLAIQATRLAAERDRANREARSSEAVAEFLSQLLDAATPERSLGQQLTVAALLDQAAVGIETQLGDEPLVRARLLHVMGSTYGRLGRYDQAAELLAEATRLRTEELGGEHVETLESRFRAAEIEVERGRYGPAEASLREIVAALERTAGPDAVPTLTAADLLAKTLARNGKASEAVDLYRRVLAARERLLGASHPDTLGARGNLAAATKNAGDYATSEQLYRETVELGRRHLPPDHPLTAGTLFNLGLLLIHQQRYADAEPFVTEAHASYLRVLGNRHDDTLRARTGLALVHQSQGRFAEAETAFQEILVIQRETLGSQHVETVATLHNLAGLYADQGRFADAEPLYRQALDGLRATLRPGHPNIGLALHALGCLHRETGDFARASADFDEAQVIFEAAGGPRHPYAIANLTEHAKLLRRTGEEAAAAAMVRRIGELSRPAAESETPG